MEHIRYPVSLCECVRITSNFCIQKIEVSDKKTQDHEGYLLFLPLPGQKHTQAKKSTQLYTYKA